MKHGDMYEVTWRDSYSTEGWCEDKDVGNIDFPIRSIGYFSKTTKHFFTIIRSIDPHDRVDGVLSIPHSVIIKKRRLK